MKTNTFFMLIIVIFLVSCTTESISMPPETTVQAATITLTLFPLVPTTTLTPTPETLADIKDLKIWVGQYVHAYGEKNFVNDIEMDASQLTDAIRKNAESFTQVKEVKGIKYSFLVVDGVPLAIRGTDGKWNEATLKNISILTDISFGIGAEPTTDPKYHLFYNFTQKDRELRFKQSILTAPADLFQTGEILHKGEGVYAWNRPDSFVTRFEQEGLQVRASYIIWANDSHPDWLIEKSKKGMQNPELYKEEFTLIMQNYINAAVTRYKGKFKDWILLNELLSTQGTLDQNNFWVKIIGSDIAKIAIQEARNADPDISIIINDYPMLWNDKKTDGMYTMLEQLKQEGYLTDNDAVGIQAHDSMLNKKWDNMVSAKDEIKSTFRRFAQLGIHIRITELDLFDVMSDDIASKLKKAAIYKTIIEACFEINAEFGNPVVDNITTWGIVNSESWQFWVKGENFGYPLYFDKDFNPEPAFYNMLKVFYENI